MSPIRSRRRAGRRTEKSPSRAELSAASSASRLSTFAPVPSIDPWPLVAVDAGASAAAACVPLPARFAVARRAAVFAAAGLAAVVFFFGAAFFWVVDLAVAPVLAGLLLPPLVRGWATARLLLHESRTSSERYPACKAREPALVPSAHP